MDDDTAQRTKTCTTCGAAKPPSGFYKDRSRSDGLEACCKTCRQSKRRKPGANRKQCLHCGDEVTRRGRKGVTPDYCDQADCYRRCRVDGCGEHGKTKGMCGTHYSRFRRHGDPLTGATSPNYNGKPCSVDDCAVGAVTRGFCGLHYDRYRRHGDPLHIRPLSSPGGPCAVDGCNRTSRIRDWCAKHYGRWYKYGDPLAIEFLRQWAKDDPDRPSCSTEGCDSDYFSNTYCKRHYYRWARYGLPEGQPNRPPHSPCRVCSTPPPHSLYRDFCSSACYASYRQHGEAVQLRGPCCVCEDMVEYFWTTNLGQRRYRHTRWCNDCRMRARSAPHAMNVEQLARRDGTDCGICRESIDMTLRRSGNYDEYMGPSVDHITPLSRGGLNVPENLQLAHLLCNIRKRDRVPN